MAAVTILLLVVALGASAPRVDLATGSGGAALLLDALTLLVVAGAVTGLVLIVSSIRLRRATPIHVERKRSTAAALLTLVALFALIWLLPDPGPRTAGPTGSDPVPGAADGLEPTPVEVDRPLIVAAAGAALALGALAALARRERRRREVPVRPYGEEPARSDLRRSVSKARSDLESIGDPREAILHSFDRLRADLAAAGVEPRGDDTPRRVVLRALAEAAAPRQPVEDLVAIYERARFSSHPVGERQRDAAIAALRTIEAALGTQPAMTT